MNKILIQPTIEISLEDSLMLGEIRPSQKTNTQEPTDKKYLEESNTQTRAQ